MTAQPPLSRQPGFADRVFGVLLIAWCAEALGRFPGQSVLTAAIYALGCALMLRHLPRFWAGLPGLWALFPFPLIALFSVAWSSVPQTSFIAALQLVFTCLSGILLGRIFGPLGLARLIAVALGLTMVASAVNLAGVSAPTHALDGGFMGVYLNKNALGQRAVVLLLVLSLLPRSKGRVVARLLWAGLSALTLILLVLSQSATSWVLAGMLGVGVALAELHRRSGPGRALALISIGTVTIGGAVALLELGANGPDVLLGLLGKDSTLTGRTELWDIAMSEMQVSPLLGQGYMGFWSDPARVQDIAIIRLFYGPTVSSFHNFALEVLVMLGPLGLIALLLALVSAARSALAHPAGRLRDMYLLLCAVLVTLSLFGSSLYRPHEISLLLVAAIAATRQPAATRLLSGVPRPLMVS